MEQPILLPVENSFYGIYYKFQWPCQNGSDKVVAVIASDKALQIMWDGKVYISEYSEAVRCDFDSGKLDFQVKDGSFTASAEIRLLHKAPLSYDIMGPFQWVPCMQCRHRIYSMESYALGKMTIMKEAYILSEARVYVEGDRGRSFPERYMWTHCFFPGGSFMLAVADVKALGRHFTGTIGIIQQEEHQLRIATYLGAKVRVGGPGTVLISQGKYRLTVHVDPSRGRSFQLLAPSDGKMTRTIKECLSGKVACILEKGQNILLDFTVENGSFEWLRL